MFKLRRKLFSQNFLHNRKLVNKLLGLSSIGKNDLALEIGPGKGIITDQLINQAQHIFAVEIDTELYRYLQKKYQNVHNITLYHQDILSFALPKIPYKVFANIPFSIEGKVIRLLLQAEHPPEDTYLVVMKDAAVRWVAAQQENMFSVMYKPWFEFSIEYEFNTSDFIPKPNVDAVLLRFKKLNVPLINVSEKKKYQQFITWGFENGLSVYSNLKKHFGQQETIKILQEGGIRKNAKPRKLTFNQWFVLYKKFYRV
jgi:23S rRNA (adenine-N6)-dimethyltransferase